jgi:selenium metabolism protein YedF
MDEAVLDCRGLPCPQPVLRCKARLEEAGAFAVLVDNEAARDNVRRFLERQGVEAAAEEAGDGLWRVTAGPSGDDESGAGASCEACAPMSAEALDRAGLRTLVFLGSDRVGDGDDELGSKLMGNFLATLTELGEELWRIILVNSGVKLAVEGSSHVETLQGLERAGASILVCGTCLDHFGLLEKKRVGETTNMLDVVTSLQLAGKVVRV